MKHTPGPWKISPVQDADFMINIGTNYEHIGAAFTSHAYNETEMEKANAKLISKAPLIPEYEAFLDKLAGLEIPTGAKCNIENLANLLMRIRQDAENLLKKGAKGVL